eukprot:jgi/Bigna1/62275/fgenesh1_kg.33_\
MPPLKVVFQIARSVEDPWQGSLEEMDHAITSAKGVRQHNQQPQHREQHFLQILLLQLRPKTSDLKDLLQKFFATTIVEYKCDKCSNAKAHVTSSFASLPNILVLHLKRFRPNFVKRTYEKKTDRIRISQTLNLPDDAGSAKNLKDWSCQKCTFKNAGTIPKCQICNTEKPSTIYNENATKDEDIAKDSCLSIKNQSGVAKQLATSKYDLQAAVLHQGTTAEAGHYVTHVKDGKKWKRYNDSHVSAIDDSSSRKKVDNEGYLLFYVKR